MRSDAALQPRGRLHQLSRAARAAAVALFAAGIAASTLHCAESTCKFNSECGGDQQCVEGKCVAFCLVDRDCPDTAPYCVQGACKAARGDAGATDADAAPTPDGTNPTPDGTNPTPDATPTGDASGPTPGQYLDPCAAASDCASGLCTAGAPSFCTRSCASKSDCADGQICGAAHVCVLDDSGTPCNPTTAAPCAQYCYGGAGSAQCTHECASATDCAAGFACSEVQPGKKICVNVEIPCNVASDCPSGLGFCGAGMVGCTATCQTDADCPTRFVGYPPYTCTTMSGQQVCVAPSDVMGSQPLGAACAATGTNQCRSDACDTGTSIPSCTQRCVPRGGCPAGYGCFPLVDTSSASLVCTAAGAKWIGDACTRANECATGVCLSGSGYCTRLCADGLCPTGYACKDFGVSADDGTRIRMCSK